MKDSTLNQKKKKEEYNKLEKEGISLFQLFYFKYKVIILKIKVSNKLKARKRKE